jgi:choline-sulfatase
LAEDPERAELVASMRAALYARFDVARISRAVIASQQARLSVFQALNTGKTYPWDYQPLRDAAQQYTRNTQDVALKDMASRYPKPPPLPPRKPFQPA